VKKVLITTPTFAKYNEVAIENLQDSGLEVVRADQPVRSDDAIIKYIDNATVAIITGLEPITKTVIESAPSLKVIAKHGIGVDNIDLKAAQEKGITVVNAPTTSSEAVADLVFGLMLSLARKIAEADNRVKAGEWPRVVGRSVWGATLGIIGLGTIGKSVARRAQGFNMKVFAYDPYFDESFAQKNDIQQASLNDILQNADFLTIHIPLTEKTKNLIGENELRQMKKTAYLVNTARGGIVNEEALFGALMSKTIAGAAIDVFAHEPATGSPLLSLPNVLTTPHMAAYTEEALQLTSEFAAQMVLEVLNGRIPSCTIV
jgi:D-3-phosphoglycerate dehydrogenase / 2-oxoglutarate reductase